MQLKPFRFLPGLILALLGCTAAADMAQKASPWAHLENKTGWILLGEIYQTSEEWATRTRHEIGREGSKAGTPRRGDVITLASETDLIILAFKRFGERHYLASPANQLLTGNDRTGIQLPAASRLRIEAIEIENPAYGLRGVWVRVTPPR